MVTPILGQVNILVWQPRLVLGLLPAREINIVLPKVWKELPFELALCFGLAKFGVKVATKQAPSLFFCFDEDWFLKCSAKLFHSIRRCHGNLTS
jgi:hypothetical protein